MTVSSDELVMSQYMNGFKTATLAEISTDNNFIAIHSISATNPFIPSSIKAHFTLTKHQDNTTTRPPSGQHLFYRIGILPNNIPRRVDFVSMFIRTHSHIRFRGHQDECFQYNANRPHKHS